MRETFLRRVLAKLKEFIPESRGTRIWIVVLSIILFITTFICNITVIPTSSMYPTVPPGSVVLLANPFFCLPIHEGSIVSFTPNEQQQKQGKAAGYESDPFFKRVIGMPGDRIYIHDGIITINGKRLDEPYLTTDSDYTCYFVVPKGKLFMLGDNRGNSDDSHLWKDPFISESQVRGIYVGTVIKGSTFVENLFNSGHSVFGQHRI